MTVFQVIFMITSVSQCNFDGEGKNAGVKAFGNRVVLRCNLGDKCSWGNA